MKPRRTHPRGDRPVLGVLLILVFSSFTLLCPGPSTGADIDVSFGQIQILDGAGRPKTVFLPGEEVQVRVPLRVLRASGNAFTVRLRIAGDGWHETIPLDVLQRAGSYSLRYGGTDPRRYVGGGANPGKVTLLADVFSEQDSVALLGRRHAYLEIRCPAGLPEGEGSRLQVGVFPYAMALTADGRFLYVTSQNDRSVTIIDVDTKTVVPAFSDPETFGFPAGVAPSPSGGEMLVADAAWQSIHVINADTHERTDIIPLNPLGALGVVSPGALAVNPVLNQVYVADSGAPRILILQLASQRVRQVFLFGIPVGPPAGLLPVKIVVDPDNPFQIYVLCQASNEIIKVSVLGNIVDFVRLSNRFDPPSLWPIWSMAVPPGDDELYVVANPGGFESTYPTLFSRIYALPRNWLGSPRRREFEVGSSLWDLTMREDGVLYAIDSFRGEILAIDSTTGTEMLRCAIPARPGGRLLLADPFVDRLFVGNWAPGYVDIVE